MHIRACQRDNCREQPPHLAVSWGSSVDFNGKIAGKGIKMERAMGFENTSFHALPGFPASHRRILGAVVFVLIYIFS